VSRRQAVDFYPSGHWLALHSAGHPLGGFDALQDRAGLVAPRVDLIKQHSDELGGLNKRDFSLIDWG